MTTYDFDLLVIGAGSAGIRASRIAGGFGARVAVCEDGPLGGTCVNVGCVPKKLYVYGASYQADLADAAGYGWKTSGTFDWSVLKKNKDSEIARLNGIYGGVISRAGVELIRGRGVMVDPHTVAIDGKKVTAEKIVVAVGGAPYSPGGVFDAAKNSDDVFALQTLPDRVVVAGGGYIAVELAMVFAGLGADVTLVHRGAQVLRGFDHDLRAHFAEVLTARGVKTKMETTITRADVRGGVTELGLSNGEDLRADFFLAAIGRRPKTRGLGLAEAGVEVNGKGAVQVNDDFQTSAPSVYAFGDVISKFELTPVALAEGMAFAKTHFGGQPTTVDYTNIPTTVFSQPPLGTVGLSEEEARANGPVRIYRSVFRPMKNTMSGRQERTLMKLVVSDVDDRVVGCHMIGPDAGEIIQGLAVALKCGATKAQFDSTIGIHPTAAEEFVTMRTPVAD